MNWEFNFSKKEEVPSYSFIFSTKNHILNKQTNHFQTVSYTHVQYHLCTYSYFCKFYKFESRKNITIKVMCVVLDSVAFTVNAEGGFSIIIVSVLWYIKTYSGMGSDIPHICFLLPSVSRSSTLHFIRLRKIAFSVCITFSPDYHYCCTQIHFRNMPFWFWKMWYEQKYKYVLHQLSHCAYHTYTL